MRKRGGEGKKKVNSVERERKEKLKGRKTFSETAVAGFEISTKGVWFYVVHVISDLTVKNESARADSSFRSGGLSQ